MKLKMMSLVVAAGIFLASCTTTRTSTSDNAAYNVNVPTNIRSNFSIAYPDATSVVWNSFDPNNIPIDWEMADWRVLNSNAYVVTFNMGSDQYYSYYDVDGNLIGTTTVVSDNTKMPYAINSMISEKYKGYTVDRIDREVSGSKTNYEIKLTQGDKKIKLLVDSNGNVLKEKMK